MSWQLCKKNNTLSSHKYSDDIINKKILIFGIIPPPLGGIAVHIQRVIHKLKAQNNQTLLIHNEKPWYMIPIHFFKLCFLLYRFKPDIIFYHSLYFKHTFLELLVVVCLKKISNFSLVFIEHDCRNMYQRSSIWKYLFNKIIKKVNKKIFIGINTYQSYVDNNMSIKNFSIESAFLPPNFEDEKAILKTYPTELNVFLQQHKPLLLINAFQLVLLENKDLYGIDQSIELLHELKNNYPQIGLIFALAQIGNENYFVRLQRTIKKYGLEENIFILTGQKELWPLFKHVDLFLRPTLSDGASVSIDEALYFNVPVIASNVVERQDGVVLFDVNIKNDFLEKIVCTLKKNKKLRVILNCSKKQKSYTEIL